MSKLLIPGNFYSLLGVFALLPKEEEEEELVMMFLGCQEPDNYYSYNDTMTLFFKNQVLFCFCSGLLYSVKTLYFLKNITCIKCVCVFII